MQEQKKNNSGSSSGSDWTIVHLLGQYHTSTSAMRGVSFKDKSGKYYYVQAAYDVTQEIPGLATNYGAYGFADLLPWQGDKIAVASLGSKETIDLEAKDPNGRPLALVMINSLYYSSGLPRHIFSTNSSDAYYPGSATSNSSKTCDIPPSWWAPIASDTTVAIQVPPGQIESVTFWSAYDKFWIVQDQSVNIQENVNNWKTQGYTKTDFMKDRVLKMISEGDHCYFYSETDDFDLTIK